MSGIRGAIRNLVEAAVPTTPLSPAERAAFEDERIDSNRRRITAVLSVFALIQTAMIILYLPRVEGPAESFRQGIWWVHATTLPSIATLSIVAWIGSHKKWRLAWLGDVVIVLCVAIGVALSLTTHRLVPTNNSYTVALLFTALILRPTIIGALLAYGGITGLFVAGVSAMQPDVEVRIPFIATGGSAAILAATFAWAVHAAAVREFLQRRTIARQQDELRAWNAELEKRVQEQVEEALAREREARALDAQLRMKVRARSHELVRAILDVGPEDEVLPAGSRFEQRFEIERALGSGAMGDVYAGRDIESGQTVAIKLMRRWDGMSPSDVGRFAMEAAATAAVVHPAIVRTYHVDVTETGRLYLVMELVAGCTLASAIANGQFDAAQTARLGAVVAEALAAAHAAGVIHRDIKPGNVMLSDSAPGVRVLDFGISKLTDPGRANQTASGQVLGTPQYMAPEQILGGELTGRCDVYALGLVLHEMLTGEPTFGGKNLGDVMRAQMVDVPVSLRTRLGEAIPEELSALVQQCLEKDPELRPTAESLAASLRLIADSLGAPPLEKMSAPRFAAPNSQAAGIAATLPAT